LPKNPSVAQDIARVLGANTRGKVITEQKSGNSRAGSGKMTKRDIFLCGCMLALQYARRHCVFTLHANNDHPLALSFLKRA
jgi:hypothetical protein